jgi:hypothetical protein
MSLTERLTTEEVVSVLLAGVAAPVLQEQP